MQIRKWEVLYALLNSWLKGLFWLIPIALSVFAVRLTTTSQFITWEAALLLIGFFAIIGYINHVIELRIGLLKESLNEVVSLLREDRNKKIEKISGRGPRSYPDGGQIQLGEYIRAIESIRANGYLEFKLDMASIKNIDYKQPISIHSVAPGMSKYFMVGSQYQPKSDGYNFVILPTDGIDSRDFTVTWFENIFQVLGHSSRNISELQESYAEGTEFGDGCFYAYKYRFYKRKGGQVFRIYL